LGDHVNRVDPQAFLLSIDTAWIEA